MNATAKSPERLTLTIDGMSCGRCVRAVTTTLEALPSVGVHSVALGSAEVDVTAAGAADAVIAALDDAGYPARLREQVGVDSAHPRTDECCCGPRDR